MDFESPAVAQKAVTALKSKGIQAQMAKVFSALCSLNFLFLSINNLSLLFEHFSQVIIKQHFSKISPLAKCYKLKLQINVHAHKTSYHN